MDKDAGTLVVVPRQLRFRAAHVVRGR
jgi:hypothetical protein